MKKLSKTVLNKMTVARLKKHRRSVYEYVERFKSDPTDYYGDPIPGFDETVADLEAYKALVNQSLAAKQAAD